MTHIFLASIWLWRAKITNKGLVAILPSEVSRFLQILNVSFSNQLCCTVAQKSPLNWVKKVTPLNLSNQVFVKVKRLKQIKDSLWYFVLIEAVVFLKKRSSVQNIFYKSASSVLQQYSYYAIPMVLKKKYQKDQKVICTFQFLGSIKFCACQVARI